jgi:hypothetical protein
MSILIHISGSEDEHHLILLIIAIFMPECQNFLQIVKGKSPIDSIKHLLSIPRHDVGTVSQSTPSTHWEEDKFISF